MSGALVDVSSVSGASVDVSSVSGASVDGSSVSTHLFSQSFNFSNMFEVSMLLGRQPSG